ncbi:MAG: hypothetical protein LCH26_00550 [Proteobacteria bacterium]|nr:hypothetical protein [Pseudomonadota bacterium]
MRKGIFVGVLVFAGLAGTAHGSTSSAVEGNALHVTMDKEGCPELKLGDPLFVYIHERYDARQEKAALIIDGEKWTMSTSRVFMSIASHTEHDSQEKILSLYAPRGACRYQYVKGEKSFTIDMKKVTSIDEDQKNKDMSSLSGYLRQLRSTFPKLTQDDFHSAVKGVF